VVDLIQIVCIYSGAWLSEETMAMREEVCEILPFILTLANETFESQKLSKVRLLFNSPIKLFSVFIKKFRNVSAPIYFIPSPLPRQLLF
jgi:hypothetical protein